MTTQVVLYTDMIGFKSLDVPDTDNREDFNAISVDTQNFVSKELLGDELFNAFSTDLDADNPTVGVPSEQKWLDLLDGVTWTEVVNEDDLTQNVIHNNEGLVNAWKFFVYREWLNQVPFANNPTGKSVRNTANSVPLDRQSLNVETQNRYNQGVDIYCTLLAFVKYYEDFKVDYTSIVESPSGTYTVTLPDTTYLKVGDKVTIDGEDYTTIIVTTDTNFQFNATTGLTFTNDFVEWFPFEDARMGEKGKLYFNGMF